MLLDPNLVPRSPTVIRISSDIWGCECDLGTRLALSFQKANQLRVFTTLRYPFCFYFEEDRVFNVYNPLIPGSNWRVNPPHNFNEVSVRQVLRIIKEYQLKRCDLDVSECERMFNTKRCYN